MCALAPELAPGCPGRLADSLALVLPALPSALAGPEAVAWLQGVARALPPLHKAGFECRLGAEPDVDLQQGIAATDREPARLARFLSGAGPLNGPWERVHDLARRWANPEDVLHGAVAELWLELDAPAREAPDTLELADTSPSVFAVLSPEPRDSVAVARAFLVALLGRRRAADLDGALSSCTRAGRAPAWLSHVGVMLGREVPALRLHVSRLGLHDLAPYLARVGWAGDGAAVCHLGEVLLDHGDELVLCLDVVHGQVARVGLECFFARRHGVDPRWELLLRRLTDLGLSSAAKAEALLRWPGTVTPVETPWPDELIVESLARGDHMLGVIDRRLSHVKLAFTRGHPVTAKAYFGYGHVWLDPRVQSAPATRRLTRAPGCGQAIARAVDHLLGLRAQNGLWRDFFDTPNVGFSDEWVTAYVADALAGVGLARARAAASRALEALMDRRRTVPGWGYHALLPSDGDATTWVLRLARSLEAPDDARLAAGRGLLARLRLDGGGLTSYTPAAAAVLAGFLGIGGSYDGWSATAHACISAPAAGLDLFPELIDFLATAQAPDGGWSSYWWEDREYATAWALAALARAQRPGDALARGARWCAERIESDGGVRSGGRARASPFATALALYALEAAGDPWRAGPAARRARTWLLEQQRADGTWAPSARMRVPFAFVHDPAAAGSIQRRLGDSGAFTTATVVRALALDRSG